MPKVTKLIDQQTVDEAAKDLAKLGAYSVVAIRLRAIIAAFKHGIKTVSEVFDINRSSLHRWVSLYRNNGLAGLGNIGKPPRSKLSEEQQTVIKDWVEKDSNVTIKKLGIMIEESFGIELSKSSIHRLLIKLGFSHITGRTRHYKADASKQVEFKKKSTREGER